LKSRENFEFWSGDGDGWELRLWVVKELQVESCLVYNRIQRATNSSYVDDFKHKPQKFFERKHVKIEVEHLTKHGCSS
jgi:hypothetical protein